MKWLALLLSASMISAGCKRKEPAAPPAAVPPAPGQPAAVGGASQVKKAISREEGERKYNRMDEVLPVRTPLAEVVRYFGQEPDRWEGAGANRKAIWVLDDGSEIAIEFDDGLSGSDSATFKNKR
ncbi:hypothetical protein [Urbifossiella limnaea]|uniref:Lipoprotein n=1 Tax=Urbifossiella limnaea TaxID=2528023 RepID=A0A517XWF7_9BACT|nr:hypothetical protein [Urbifossiella limnaea]QDU21840.1 hypothetical protein ETAA1_38130 [Urbifossiella limnaea]